MPKEAVFRDCARDRAGARLSSVRRAVRSTSPPPSGHRCTYQYEAKWPWLQLFLHITVGHALVGWLPIRIPRPGHSYVFVLLCFLL